MDLVLGPDDPGDPHVRVVLDAHLASAREVTPAGHVHALDANGLHHPDVDVHSARRGTRVVAVGALRRLGHGHVELKSMHTIPEVRGQGVGRKLLVHLLREARAAGHRRISLETGTYPAFAPARTLYTSAGFGPRAPFGTYTADPHSVCMTRSLDGGLPDAPSGAVVVTSATTDELDAGRLAEIRSLCRAAFGADFSDDDWAHTIGGHHVLALDAGTVVSHAAVVERLLVAGSTPLRAGYVEGVATVPERQGAGLGSAVMRAVRQHLVGGYEVGALSTGEHRFDARLGWTPWRGPTHVRTEGGLVRTPEDDDGMMVLRFGRHSGLDPTQRLIAEERQGDDW